MNWLRDLFEELGRLPQTLVLIPAGTLCLAMFLPARVTVALIIAQVLVVILLLCFTDLGASLRTLADSLPSWIKGLAGLSVMAGISLLAVYAVFRSELDYFISNNPQPSTSGYARQRFGPQDPWSHENTDKAGPVPVIEKKEEISPVKAKSTAEEMLKAGSLAMKRLEGSRSQVLEQLASLNSSLGGHLGARIELAGGVPSSATLEEAARSMLKDISTLPSDYRTLVSDHDLFLADAKQAVSQFRQVEDFWLREAKQAKEAGLREQAQLNFVVAESWREYADNLEERLSERTSYQRMKAIVDELERARRLLELVVSYELPPTTALPVDAYVRKFVEHIDQLRAALREDMAELQEFTIRRKRIEESDERTLRADLEMKPRRQSVVPAIEQRPTKPQLEANVRQVRATPLPRSLRAELEAKPRRQSASPAVTAAPEAEPRGVYPPATAPPIVLDVSLPHRTPSPSNARHAFQAGTVWSGVASPAVTAAPEPEPRGCYPPRDSSTGCAKRYFTRLPIHAE